MNVLVGKTSTGNSDKVMVVEGGKVVSSCLVRPRLSGKWALVSRVRTHKAHRGKGYATLVLQKAVDAFGSMELRLTPHPDNTGGAPYEKLRDLYGRFGFRSIDGIKRMVRAGSQE